MVNTADSSVPPRITVLVPICNPEPKHLLELIYSLIHQKYEGWECIFVYGEQDPLHIQAIFELMANKDVRFKCYRQRGVEAQDSSLDSGMKNATGQYVCVAEDTGLFTPMAFHEVVSHLMRFKETEVVFADDDMMDDEGVVYATCIKSGCPVDWVIKKMKAYPPVFLNVNLFNRLGGFSKLALSNSGLQEAKMAYIPHTLYHRRDIGSKLRAQRLRRANLQNSA